jgi:hypothetical protein
MKYVRRLVTLSTLTLMGCNLGLGPAGTSSETSEETSSEASDEESLDASSDAPSAAEETDCNACEADLKTHCAGLFDEDTGNISPSWQSWCQAQTWASDGNNDMQDCASSKYAVVNCLANHADEISAACKEAQEKRKEANKALPLDCGPEMKQYCDGVEPAPGATPIEDCLYEHYDQLSEKCRETFDAHEALACK